jgi:hypothetical protein
MHAGLLPTLAAAALAPSLAAGCELSEPPAGWRDARIAVGADCSFTEAGHTFHLDGSGPAPKDLGGGRIGQRWTWATNCGAREELVVVDCTTREAIGIEGRPYEQGTIGGTSVDLLYAPKGPIRLTARSTVPALAAIASAAGLTAWTDVSARLRDLKPRNRPDPYCGCRLFYPDSDGAK